jgi:two-component system response regulator
MKKENEIEILLVDDNVYDAELAIRAFKKHHMANNVLHLKDGEETLEFIFGKGKFADRDTGNKPKVILLDLKMPKINGMEVLEQIKKNPKTSSIPVVVLTSSKEDPDIKKCYELGANSYIVKPVNFENFFTAVSEIGFYWVLLNQSPH